MNAQSRPERRAQVRSACRVAVKVYESSAGWCVRWSTRGMRAPGFWYYADEKKARQVAAQLQGRAK